MMPFAMDQNKNMISIGSFMAVRNLTIDKAPTMPRESTTLLTTAIINTVVMIERAINAVPKDVEHMVPAWPC